MVLVKNILGWLGLEKLSELGKHAFTKINGCQYKVLIWVEIEMHVGVCGCVGGCVRKRESVCIQRVKR